jgi:hypothetical protein
VTSDAASGRAGLWKRPTFPGESVRQLDLIRTIDGGAVELGDVRIQFIHDNAVKVCTFLPGVLECRPGDTPKCWPELCEFATSVPAADALFDNFVQEAYADGWQNYYPEIHGRK